MLLLLIAAFIVCLAVAVPTRGAHGPSLGLSVTALKATYSQEQGAMMVKELKDLARSLGNPMGSGPHRQAPSKRKGINPITHWLFDHSADGLALPPADQGAVA